ncbi:hypothetical protein VZT92_005944 [Zoarces viviparus]|uniref:Uncharacterized protein n=1 Tax=Zoarces viviparus TaxID=48416 RepID=A0AAW1FMR2_ZOAVI
MADKDALVHQMEEIQTPQKNASEKEKTFFKDFKEEVSHGQNSPSSKKSTGTRSGSRRSRRRLLKREVEELKTKLQSVEILSGCQEEKVKQLTTELEKQTLSMNKWRQISCYRKRTPSLIHQILRC